MKEQKGKREEGENRRGKRRGRKRGGAGGRHCHRRRRRVVARKARTEGEREPRKEKEASPSRVAVVTVEVFIVAVHRGLQIEGRRAVLPRAATGRVVVVKLSHHRLCFAPPDLSPGEKQNARGERSGRKEVLPPLELRCCCCHARRASAAKKCQGGTVRCCVVPVAVRMYLNQVVVAIGAELFLSLSRFPGLSPATFCRYSGPNSALIRFILLQSSLS
ncbi:uncharacterized protein LOC107607775 [Arachis ipaensis]|uniref:uncharacterized protein LOC107607775 n=1 Tax=Arachis ipaensis TaxID=130454 RepID=UPI000A2B3C4E|nr:uncharacterized protein LOC107607775 [Arachis ipaensis]